MIKQTDIIIVGGGLIGLTCALALAPSNLSIMVIDAAPKAGFPQNEPELRVSAVSKASQKVFENLEVWPLLNRYRLAPYQAMNVWEQDSFARIQFDAQSVQMDNLGHIIENRHLVAALTEKIQQTLNIEYLASANITKMGLGQDTNVLQLADGQLITAKLVIGADGANSSVCKQAQFPQTFWDYEQTAIVATIDTQLPHQHIARQAFTPTGPLAFLPLWQQHQCSIVWSQDTERAQALLALDTLEFEKQLATAFNLTLGTVKLASARKHFPLRMQYARQWLANGVMIIGDAAHSIHPLAGQGANLGILDAVALAERINELVAQEMPFHLAKHLRVTERWRKTEAAKMTATMETFKRLFAGGNPLKKLIRGAGMSLVNDIAPLKSDIIKQAMGTAGELPKLAK